LFWVAKGTTRNLTAPWIYLKEGDDVVVHAAGKPSLEIEKAPSTKELIARLRKFRGRLPADFKSMA
jgi:antitoxin MazE